MQNILQNLAEKSNPFEITLAKIFTTVFKFEKRCEALKIALFKQDDVKYATDL